MMKMKYVLSNALLFAAPILGMAQYKSGFDPSNLDKSVRPGDDFYQFATGGWQKNNPLPAAYSRFGAFDLIGQNNNKRVNSILTDLSKKKYKAGTLEQKLSDFYKLAMNMDRRNKEGVTPVKPVLNEIAQAKTIEDLRNLQLKYAEFGYGVPFSSFFGADEKNVSMNILNLYQGGLTLGQRDWYVNNDKATVDIRNAYQQYIVDMFKLYGFTEAQARAKRDEIFRFETMIALISKSNTELRDPEANYNKMSLKEFEEAYPHVPLQALAQAEGVKSEHIQAFIVGQPKFFEGLDRLYSLQHAEQLRALMEWDVIQSSYDYLGDDVQEASFNFFGKTMSGRKENYPLWKRATDQVQSAMGEALGKIYCQRYFPESSKKMMEELVRNLQTSLGQRIDAQTWMSGETKQAAHKKLDRFLIKIGYPDKWKDYSGLTIDPSKSLFDNVQACRSWASKRHIAEKAGKPVDRQEWHMTPQTVNAYYNPTTNEICFPAGILQKPFFDPKADEAYNYGGIGVVIGHEMTHGFDDQGHLYDADGNLSNWWTTEDEKEFKKRANSYADFFSNIEVLPGLHGNGQFTLGENLADHGGLEVAFNAFKNATAGKKLKNIGGFAPDQRFFLSYSEVWAQNITEQEIRNRVKRDPHAQGEWRVNGALPHIDAWYKAFDIQPGDKLFIPENERLKLW